MPDIAMCLNNQCPNSGNCYRVKAQPKKYQDYMNFTYTISSAGVVCDSFIPLRTVVSTNSSIGIIKHG